MGCEERANLGTRPKTPINLNEVVSSSPGLARGTSAYPG